MTKRDKFLCFRCLEDDGKAIITVPDKVIKTCDGCGVENWCLSVKRTEAVETTEGTSEEVAESIEVTPEEGAGPPKEEGPQESPTEEPKKQATLASPNDELVTVEADEPGEKPGEPSPEQAAKDAEILRLEAELAGLKE